MWYSEPSSTGQLRRPTEEPKMSYSAKTCTIESDGCRFYLSFGCTKSRRDFKTVSGARRHAESNGIEVTKCVNPDAVSVAEMIKVEANEGQPTILHLIGMHNCTIFGEIEGFNLVLERFGYKPVKLTKNMLNPNSPWIVIDKDTPSYLDVGSETYWSM
jgi:hypothetical protein